MPIDIERLELDEVLVAALVSVGLSPLSGAVR